MSSCCEDQTPFQTDSHEDRLKTTLLERNEDLTWIVESCLGKAMRPNRDIVSITDTTHEMYSCLKNRLNEVDFDKNDAAVFMLEMAFFSSIEHVHRCYVDHAEKLIIIEISPAESCILDETPSTVGIILKIPKLPEGYQLKMRHKSL